MAPMTRRRGLEDFVPTPIMAEYYAQRASIPGTLLITEATSVSPRSAAVPNTPGLFTAEQIQAWRTITEVVHKNKSFIYAQLWVTGRVTREPAIARGAEVVGPSPIPWNSEAVTPRELQDDEILQLIEDFRQAAINAVEAGFDGVEIHGANGYIGDQFTQDISNQRTDRWGGSIENRAKFGLAVATAIVDAIGADRVGYRISPWSYHHGMRMSDPAPQFLYLVKELRKLKLAYLSIIEARVKGNEDYIGSSESIDQFVEVWDNASPVIVGGGYTAETAREVVDGKYETKDVIVAFGRFFTSNPDLPFRLQKDISLTHYQRPLFWTQTAGGYTDFAFSKEYIESRASRLPEQV